MSAVEIQPGKVLAFTYLDRSPRLVDLVSGNVKKLKALPELQCDQIRIFKESGAALLLVPTCRCDAAYSRNEHVVIKAYPRADPATKVPDLYWCRVEGLNR